MYRCDGYLFIPTKPYQYITKEVSKITIKKTVTIGDDLNADLIEYNKTYPNHKISPSRVMQAALAQEIKRCTQEREQE